MVLENFNYQPIAELGRAQQQSIAGRASILWGMPGPYWGMSQRAVYGCLTAVFSGQVTTGSEFGIADTAASFGEDDALVGMELVVSRVSVPYVMRGVITASGSTSAMVGSWTVEGGEAWDIYAGDLYVIQSRSLRGVVGTVGGTGSKTITPAPSAAFRTAGGGLGGCHVCFWNPTTYGVKTGFIVSNTATSFTVRDWAWGWSAAAGDLYYIGGWPWRWVGPVLRGSRGRMVRLRSVSADIGAEGYTRNFPCAVRLNAAAAGHNDPPTVATVLMNPAGTARRTDEHRVLLPGYWGTSVQVEIYGIAHEQEIRVHGVAVEIEER